MTLPAGWEVGYTGQRERVEADLRQLGSFKTDRGPIQGSKPTMSSTSVSPSSAPAIVTEGLTKSYGALRALTDCSLQVPRGECFGLLGPNGAGKSTLIRLLMGLLAPTAGRASILGHDCRRESLAVRRQVAYLPGDARLPRHMTGHQAVRFFAQVRGAREWSAGEALAGRLELDLRRRVAWMSTGMRQKLALAVTLAAPVAVMILDEPTANLDPTVRGEVLRIIQERVQQGTTILFSSHVLSEIEATCARATILRQGQVVHTQCLADLRRRHRIMGTLSGPVPDVPAAFQDRLTLTHSASSGAVVLETHGDLAPLLSWLGQIGLRDVSVEPIGLRAIYDSYHSAAAAGPPVDSADAFAARPSSGRLRTVSAGVSDSPVVDSGEPES